MLPRFLVASEPRAFAGRRLCCYKDHWCILELQLILERSSLVLSIEADCRLGTAFGGGGSDSSCCFKLVSYRGMDTKWGGSNDRLAIGTRTWCPSVLGEGKNVIKHETVL